MTSEQPSNCGALAAILPQCVSAAATRGDIPGATLTAEEEEAMAQAVERRRREFATGRACARAALRPLGLAGRSLPVGPSGAPLWPPRIVGSITHCDGLRACAVARGADLLAIGIDAEPNLPLPERVLPEVAFGAERERLRDLVAAEPAVCWGRLLFCVKEAVYKAWHPLAGRWLGFKDTAVEFERAAGSFSARLLVPGPRLPDGSRLDGFAGRWAVADGLLLAAVAVGAGQDDAALGGG